jgi:hypothetical protein
MNEKEKNFKKLSRTPILMNFVKRNNGEWNHEQWLELCLALEKKSYNPIDLNKVGTLLEKKKETYFIKNQISN